MSEKNKQNKINWSIIIIVIFVLIIAYILVRQSQINDQIKQNNENILSTLSETNKKVSDIETVLLSTQEKNLTLEEALNEALEESEERSKDLERQFERVTDDVDELEKITKTDPELLQKYSKVYFLNEHYAPEDLETIPSKYTYDSNREYEIHEKVWPFLEDLLEEAEDDGIDLQIISAFRSFGEQSQLKNNYTVVYGAGSANQFSADQGYSEHQLGTTVDFTNSELGAAYESFAITEEYQWLRKNAHKYGFVLSYPENNQYYQFEPWHWRFVGEKLADDLHDDNEYFYDLSQRDIDKYIVDLFD